MDASKTACEVMLKKIREDQPLFNHKIETKPLTASDFAKLKPLEFEKSAVRSIGGVTNHAQVGDGGIDGRLAFDSTPIQVKKFDKLIRRHRSVQSLLFAFKTAWAGYLYIMGRLLLPKLKSKLQVGRGKT